MADEENQESVAEQNRRKLQEHLAKIQKHQGVPPPEQKPPPEQPQPEPEEQRRFQRDWETWKKAYRGRVVDLSAGPVKDTAADFALLGVPQGASKEEIRKAFYRHAKQNHPDTGGDVEKFRRLMEAYTRLTGGR